MGSMKNILSMLLLCGCITFSFAEVGDTLTDSDIGVGDSVTLMQDSTYIMSGFVYVESTAVLNIEEGVVVKSLSGQAENATALIISRGGKINAVGKKDNPIIFTSVSDDVTDATDLGESDRGLWGGVLLLGKAPLNFTDGGGGENNIEGIPSSEIRGLYGGDDASDNSGVMKYVSIRHAGSVIGGDNEINGLTFGAVGSGTTIDHIEVFANLDDGFEWFGGTVNTKNLIAAYCGDDAFDYDEGFRGKGQFWFAIHTADEGNRGGEHDGGPSSCEACRPYAIPTVYNATYIGSGKDSDNADSEGIILRDNAGAKYYNSIFYDFPGTMLKIEDLSSGHDSKDMYTEGNIEFAHNIFYNFGAGDSISDIVLFDGASDASDLVDDMKSWGNKVVDPQIGSVGRAVGESLDPHPAANGPAAYTSDLQPYTDTWFDDVTYKGAFGHDNWANGWTSLSQLGILVDWEAQQASVGDTLTDDDIQEDQTVTLQQDSTYILKGFVYVEDGAELIIEEGVKIKALSGQAEDASALIVARGGKINAQGTATNPIIFTSVSDDLTDGTDLGPSDRGLWGGVLLLGKAPLNFTDGGGGENNVEGIPATEVRGKYGGDNPYDNSGVMKYVSIRHAGSVIGGDNEINGLTFGAVGSGTTIDHVEVYANLDDGFEWFGGTVNTKHLIAAYCGDDAFDYDEGFRGKGQFWFAIHTADEGNRGGEHDGGPSSCETCEPYAIPTVYNATYIGSGKDSDNADSEGMILRDNAGAKYYNSIFTDFPGTMLKIEDLSSGGDSKQMFENGHIEFAHNIFYNFGAGNTLSDIVLFDGAAGNDALVDSMRSWGDTIVDPKLVSIGRDIGETLDPHPMASSPAMYTADLKSYDDDFFTSVNYKGAFGHSNWANNWTALSEAGILADWEAQQATVGDTLTDDDIEEGETVTLTQGNTYIMKGFVYVEDGAVLNIEKGVTIKSLAGQAEDATALIIARGGKINATGTRDNPIIFTSVSDDLTDPDDLGSDDRGLWGGVLLLGKAPLNFTDGGGGENNVEGIPSTEIRGLYGGSDANDNSGVMNYVSIRHGGSVIGGDNEINGLTFGAVGSGTIIDNIEVYANLDDGFEWFGGTVNTKHLVAAFCGDDAFDYDEGFRGNGQFWFALQASDDGNRGGEHDGGPSSCETCQPYAIPTVYNATYIGSGSSSDNADSEGIILRDNAGAMYKNSIFTDFTGTMLKIEDLSSGGDSKQMFENGNIVFANNIFYNFGAGSNMSDIVIFDGDAGNDALVDSMTAWNNTIVDPQLAGIGREGATTLDPRPSTSGPAYENLASYPSTWFEDVSYKGAFGDEVWVKDWTAMSGVLSPTISVHEMLMRQDGMYTTALQPAMQRGMLQLRYSLSQKTDVDLAVYSVSGKRIATLATGERKAGVYNVGVTQQLANGFYVVRLRTEHSVISKGVSLVR